MHLEQEELKREKEAKVAETARYEKEMEAGNRLAAAEKERKAAARVKEMERAEKVERSRKETERLLAKQQAEVDKKKVSSYVACSFRTEGYAYLHGLAEILRVFKKDF